MPGPLDGVRVVDCTNMVSGPMATMMLGDPGADVVKVEAPGSGDLVRQMGAGRRGMSPTFATVNRNKRSVVLNLREPRGRALLEQLVERADVFVQNFRPGTAERMGIGEVALRRDPRPRRPAGTSPDPCQRAHRGERASARRSHAPAATCHALRRHAGGDPPARATARRAHR